MDDSIVAEILGDNLWISTNERDSVAYGLRYLNDDPNDLIARKRRIVSCFEDYIMNHYRCY